jgi:hypothetical protein
VTAQPLLNITSNNSLHNLASALKLGYDCLLPGRTTPRPPSCIQIFLRQFANLHTEAVIAFKQWAFKQRAFIDARS